MRGREDALCAVSIKRMRGTLKSHLALDAIRYYSDNVLADKLRDERDHRVQSIL